MYRAPRRCGCARRLGARLLPARLPAVALNSRGPARIGIWRREGGRRGPGKDCLRLPCLSWKDVKLCSCVRRRTAGKALDSRVARVGGVKLCLRITMENTLLYTGDGGAVKLFWGENSPGKCD